MTAQWSGRKVEVLLYRVRLLRCISGWSSVLTIVFAHLYTWSEDGQRKGRRDGRMNEWMICSNDDRKINSRRSNLENLFVLFHLVNHTKWYKNITIFRHNTQHTCTQTLGPTYNEFAYNEHLANNEQISLHPNNWLMWRAITRSTTYNKQVFFNRFTRYTWDPVYNLSILVTLQWTHSKWHVSD